MINAIKYLKSTGDILGQLQLIGEDDLSIYETDEIGCMEADIAQGDTSWYVSNGELTKRPEKPSPYYVWDGNYWIADNTYLENDIRWQRDLLLSESDWVVIKAKEYDQEVSQEWKDYRQALRDITKQSGFPLNVVFPEKPSI